MKTVKRSKDKSIDKKSPRYAFKSICDFCMLIKVYLLIH